mmetsp:Transcript_43171/g.65188  ORF Transcript_43171/g.65188 Transcript_43171/m.65188 type:complete len:285 (-) Transcript_43171:188-1042(-)
MIYNKKVILIPLILLFVLFLIDDAQLANRNQKMINSSSSPTRTTASDARMENTNVKNFLYKSSSDSSTNIVTPSPPPPPLEGDDGGQVLMMKYQNDTKLLHLTSDAQGQYPIMDDVHDMMPTTTTTTTDSSSSSNFCSNTQMSMAMYMTGFQSTFLQKNNNNDNYCLNIYFPPWILDNAMKFTFAMFGSFALAFFMEVLFVSQKYVHVTMKPSRERKMIKVGLHVVQELLGYLIMLVVMMLSIEMLFSVLAGLMVGYAWFYDVREEKQQQQQQHHHFCYRKFHP